MNPTFQDLRDAALQRLAELEEREAAATDQAELSKIQARQVMFRSGLGLQRKWIESGRFELSEEVPNP